MGTPWTLKQTKKVKDKLTQEPGTAQEMFRGSSLKLNMVKHLLYSSDKVIVITSNNSFPPYMLLNDAISISH